MTKQVNQKYQNQFIAIGDGK